MGTIVRITGWRRGLLKVSMTQTIRRYTGLGLKEGKECTDRVLDGDTVEVEVRDAAAAADLVRELDAFGAVAEVKEDPV